MHLFEEHFSSACLFVMDFLKVFGQKLNELSNKKSKTISNLFWMLSTEINACLLGYFSIVVIFFFLFLRLLFLDLMEFKKMFYIILYIIIFLILYFHLVISVLLIILVAFAFKNVYIKP